MVSIHDYMPLLRVYFITRLIITALYALFSAKRYVDNVIRNPSDAQQTVWHGVRYCWLTRWSRNFSVFSI